MSDLLTRAGSFQLGPLDLTVHAGRALVVLGPSGAGKSMLLDTIAGFRTPRRGSVRLNGRDLTGVPADERRIGVVFQDAALFPHLSVRDNVGFAPALRGRRHSPEIGELLARFGIAHLAHRAPRSLSGGERQRVALARALAARPAALLLDEPLSALDQPVREELREVLRATLLDLAVPTIHVTHDRDEALRLADDLAILDAGTLRQTGPADQLTRQPTDAVTARLLGWTELGPATPEAGGLHVGDLAIDPALLGAPATRGTVYYRPEEVRVGGPDQYSSALRVRTKVVEVVPTVPLARVLLATTPPLAALVLHRDLPGLAGEVDVTVPGHALRLIESSAPAPPS
ncbi:sulfate/molybdate ABC transporter ATP-binding protein [Amycolatopsis sp. FDAARGOS 1241]|uniref:sulfate/molybdate ABC transporter ATP-binding protein n=1 Tax=Amycolatopsis sp. FDAARGOS 1241 TaxID=2778070 RepID=UPI001951A727|nr:ABC transporter ATP-binding protein [Amycolatopsis sp. FDAARGOS 1241]QRP50316.1 ABC transporter ATP-binding protein [Amycolatopsis sp. FDAARGOS 1241]